MATACTSLCISVMNRALILHLPCHPSGAAPRSWVGPCVPIAADQAKPQSASCSWLPDPRFQPLRCYGWNPAQPLPCCCHCHCCCCLTGAQQLLRLGQQGGWRWRQPPIYVLSCLRPCALQAHQSPATHSSMEHAHCLRNNLPDTQASSLPNALHDNLPNVPCGCG